MKKQQLDRLMRLARKTKSPIIVLDEQSEEMVILPMQTYEQLIQDASFIDDEEYLDLPEDVFMQEGDLSEEVNHLLEEGIGQEENISTQSTDNESRVEKEDLVEDFEEKKEGERHEKVQGEVEEQFYLEPIE